MKKQLINSPLITFFSLAFLFSWLGVVPKLLYPGLPVEPFLILGALGGPFLSAVITVTLTEGRPGLGRFGRRYIQLRVGPGWWLFVLFGTFLALNLAATLFFGLAIWNALVRSLPVIFPAYTAALVFGMILGPLWEEGGWRGFALPRLQAQFGPVAGSLILGVLWALWHLPGYLGGWMSATAPTLLISCIGFSLIATWVNNRTGGSILLLVLLHASSNAAVAVGTFVLPADLSSARQQLVAAGWIPAIAHGALALFILFATRGRLAYQRAPATAPQFP